MTTPQHPSAPARAGPSAVIVAARPRWQVGVGAAVVLVLAAASIAIVVSLLGASGSSEVVQVPTAEPGAVGADPGAIAVDPLAPTSSTVVVHMLGAVLRPGVFELRAGDRLLDAIAAAGGFSETADRAQLNLARTLVDGEQIIVPAVGEVMIPAPGAGPGTTAGGLVNLNSADAAALDTLPGVGPTTAESIIVWRTENGRFASVDDLLSVPGIGDKTLENLRELVMV